MSPLHPLGTEGGAHLTTAVSFTECHVSTHPKTQCLSAPLGVKV